MTTFVIWIYWLVVVGGLGHAGSVLPVTPALEICHRYPPVPTKTDAGE
jgi:hypothetical protein